MKKDNLSDSGHSTEIFESQRSRLLGLAYRMLGARSEAEDVVQEVWLRWHRSEHIEDPERWLFKVTSRVALDHLKSARHRRERYIGPWLPEPVSGALGGEPMAASGFDSATGTLGGSIDSVDPVELADSLSMALLAVLERLTPSERAAFLLRQVFDYSYAEVGEVIGKSEAACRQLVHRAHRHLAKEKPRFDIPRGRREELMQRFASAANEGDLSPLETWLDRDVVLYADGGGKVPSALLPIYGADKVARFFQGVWPKRPAGTELEPRVLNGEPALIAVAGRQPVQTMHFEFGDGGRIKTIFIVRNPDKLTGFRDPEPSPPAIQ